ncbi:MAG: lysine--tRNA ligase [Kiritimatiellia bacterium]|jgi:lysyl-tRNA synthetase class 2
MPESPAPAEARPSPNEYRQQRLANLAELEARGHKPFGAAFKRTGSVADIHAAFAEHQAVRAAGRVMSVRNMGKTVFADLRDGTGRIQLFINKNHLGDEGFDAFKFIDLGDHVGVEGELFTTRTGEPSIRVEKWTLLAKALQQPPEKFHGLQDVEDRYRQRHFDLVSNPESRDRFNKRIAIVREIRNYLDGLGFQEVETPMMQPQPGGAAARPFMTHYNALDCTMYMRIAPELYLKRLLVGGFDKIFEMNRNFRNEGLDRTHNPEFTVLEIYEAYGDRLSMKAILEGMIPHVCDKVLGTRQIPLGDGVLDFTPPYREVAYHDLVREHMGADWFERPADDARAAAEAAGVDCDPAWDHLLVTHEVYDKLIEKTLFQPTFVTRVPRQFIPLAKACADDPALADVFEFVVAGRELCPGYTEQNDPLAQREAFANQAGDEVEKIDEDFIAALEAGMPPAGGLGLGIDRFVMMLTGADAIRDVILFPQLKPKA